MEKTAFVDFMKTASPNQKEAMYQAVARAAFRDELEKTAGWAQNALNTTKRVGQGAWNWAKNNKLEVGLTAASLALPFGWAGLAGRLGAGALARFGAGAAARGLARVGSSRVAGGMLQRGAAKALTPGSRFAKWRASSFAKQQAAKKGLGMKWKDPTGVTVPGAGGKYAKIPEIQGTGAGKAFAKSFGKPSRKQVGVAAASLALPQYTNVARQVNAPGIRASSIAPVAKGWVG